MYLHIIYIHMGVSHYLSDPVGGIRNLMHAWAHGQSPNEPKAWPSCASHGPSLALMGWALMGPFGPSWAEH